MSKTVRLLLLIVGTCSLAVLILVTSAISAQDEAQPSMPADHSRMDHSGMGGMNRSQMRGVDHSKLSDPDAAKADEKEMDETMQSMSHRHMDMGPHMRMTELRAANAKDRTRAGAILERLRPAIQKYKDVHVAEGDGYQEFLPNIPEGMKHFTNWHYAIEALFHFNPEHPTSLLYEKHGSYYKLIGAMYTAPKRFGEDDLDKRVPLSVAQWHEHVHMCAPPKGQESEYFKANARFGLAGSITGRDECEAAGGKFYPVVFNWMVHVYPFESSQADVWSVERQMASHKHAD